MKLNHCIIPLIDSTDEISDFNNQVQHFCLIIDAILDHDGEDEDDKVWALDCIYESFFSGNIAFSDYLFNSKYSSDSRELLFETIMKLPSCDVTLENLIEAVNSGDDKEHRALIGIKDCEIITDQRLYINHINKINFPHRYYLERTSTLEDFKKHYQKCFPNLIFHSRVDRTLSAFHDITKYSEELVRHLTILNDFAKKLYEEYSNGAERVYSELRATHKIRCSGKGSNEKLDMFLCEFPDKNNKLIQIRCSPHTKLYENYSDLRIYFHWGNKSIHDGKLLIGHVGAHWK